MLILKTAKLIKALLSTKWLVSKALLPSKTLLPTKAREVPKLLIPEIFPKALRKTLLVPKFLLGPKILLIVKNKLSGMCT